jgi:hypothetical protein
MSAILCSYCDRLCDGKDGEGEYDVPRVNSAKPYEYICGICREKYINEDGQFDPDLPEKEAIISANAIKGAFYIMDTINGREGSPEGRAALKEILEGHMARQK